MCSESSDAAECGGEGGRRSATVSKQDWLSASGESLGISVSSANLTGAGNPALPEELQSALTWELSVCAFTHLWKIPRVPLGALCGGEMDPQALWKAHRSSQDLLSCNYVSGTLTHIKSFYCHKSLRTSYYYPYSIGRKRDWLTCPKFPPVWLQSLHTGLLEWSGDPREAHPCRWCTGQCSSLLRTPWPRSLSFSHVCTMGFS